MAAPMRSALARFGRRACITAPPRMPPLRPAADLNIEGLQWYSNGSSRLADKKKWMLMNSKSENFLSTSRQALKTVMEAHHYLHAVTVFGLTIYAIHVLPKFWHLGQTVMEDDGKDKD